MQPKTKKITILLLCFVILHTTHQILALKSQITPVKTHYHSTPQQPTTIQPTEWLALSLTIIVFVKIYDIFMYRTMPCIQKSHLGKKIPAHILSLLAYAFTITCNLLLLYFMNKADTYLSHQLVSSKQTNGMYNQKHIITQK